MINQDVDESVPESRRKPDRYVLLLLDMKSIEYGTARVTRHSLKSKTNQREDVGMADRQTTQWKSIGTEYILYEICEKVRFVTD